MKHLQIRTGMSARDARDELKERGVTDPYKGRSFTGTVRNSQENRRTENQSNEQNEQDLDQTQQFRAQTSPSPRAEKTNEELVDSSVIQINNRFAGMNEESLEQMDDNEGNQDGVSMSQLEGFWDSSSQPKPQRNSKGKKTQGKQNGKVALNKRSRDTSPVNESSSTTEDKQKASPPPKKGFGLEYSSTSDDELEVAENESTEKKGMPIPTVITTNPGRPTEVRERIPNPFRGEDVALWDQHPLRNKSPSPTRHKNDLEGVRDELKKMKEAEEKGKQKVAHPSTCGCELCFWDEKGKIGTLTEKTVADLIENFTKNRNPNSIPRDKKHAQLCMCILCIKRKIEESKEETMKELLNKKDLTTNKDPRISKELNQTK